MMQTASVPTNVAALSPATMRDGHAHSFVTNERTNDFRRRWDRRRTCVGYRERSLSSHNLAAEPLIAHLRFKTGFATYNLGVNSVWLNRLLMLVAAAGLFVAGMLSVSHLMNIQVPCGESAGCFTVQNHPSSKWGGIPVAYFGFASYLMLAVLASARGNVGVTKNRSFVMAGFWVSAAGTVVSVVLTIYALTVIKAACQWCIASAALMTLSFLIHAVLAQADPTEGPEMDSFALPVTFVVIAFGLLGWKSNELVTKSKTMGSIRLENLSSMSLENLIPKDAISIGPEDAPVTVVEFADMTCGMCKTSYTEMKNVFAKYNGKMRWVFRHFPLLYKGGEHQFALPAALMAEAMNAKGKGWQFLDASFQLELNKIQSSDPHFQIAELLGEDRNKLTEAIQDKNGVALRRLETDLADADKLGIKETPTFFVIPKGGKPIPANVNMLGEVLMRPEVQAQLGGSGPVAQ